MTTSSVLRDQLQIAKGDRVLVFGIGNDGRQDDGIGIHLFTALEQRKWPSGWGLDADYQLNAEVALQISEYQVVLFLDASRKQIDSPFYLEEIVPDERVSFSTHAMSAASVLGLCVRLYAVQPRCYWIGVPGESWGYGVGLSDRAEYNVRQLLMEFDSLLGSTGELHA